MVVPAGFNNMVYEPQFALSDDKKSYKSVAGTTATKVAQPQPFSIEFWGAPGDEPVMLKIASAYEAATHHRKPPEAFPALKGKASKPAAADLTSRVAPAK